MLAKSKPRWQVEVLCHPLCSWHAVVSYDGRLRWVTPSLKTEAQARASAASWVLQQRLKQGISK